MLFTHSIVVFNATYKESSVSKLSLLLLLFLALPCRAINAEDAYLGELGNLLDKMHKEYRQVKDQWHQIVESVKSPMQKEYDGVRNSVFNNRLNMLKECSENPNDTCEKSANSFIESLNLYQGFLQRSITASPKDKGYILAAGDLNKSLVESYPYAEGYCRSCFTRLNANYYQELFIEAKEFAMFAGLSLAVPIALQIYFLPDLYMKVFTGGIWLGGYFYGGYEVLKNWSWPVVDRGLVDAMNEKLNGIEEAERQLRRQAHQDFIYDRYSGSVRSY